jgi:hypothetical protein
MTQVKMTLGNLLRDKNELKRERIFMTKLVENVTDLVSVRVPWKMLPFRVLDFAAINSGIDSAGRFLAQLPQSLFRLPSGLVAYPHTAALPLAGLAQSRIASITDANEAVGTMRENRNPLALNRFCHSIRVRSFPPLLRTSMAMSKGLAN